MNNDPDTVARVAAMSTRHIQFIRALAFLHAALDRIGDTIEACVIYEDMSGHVKFIYARDIKPLPDSNLVLVIGRDGKHHLLNAVSSLDIYLRFFPDMHDMDTEEVPVP